MKKITFFGLLIVFLPTIVFAQEKIEAPVWNAGDKWTFTGNGNIEVIKVDQGGYILKFSENNCIFETQGCNTIFLGRATGNRINAIEGDKHKKYLLGLSKVLDFPLSMGKQWKTTYSGTGSGPYHQLTFDYSEVYKVFGWEDITTQGGKFKALRVEYRRKTVGSSGTWANVGEEIINQYWFSPDVKYFVKCQYDKDWMKGEKDIFNWELNSFQLKK